MRRIDLAVLGILAVSGCAPQAPGAPVGSTNQSSTAHAAQTNVTASHTVLEASAPERSLANLYHFDVQPVVDTRLANGGHVAHLVVTVVDQGGNPVPDVDVVGAFTGSIDTPVTVTTGADGTATASVSAGGPAHVSVGFVVESAQYHPSGHPTAANIASELFPPVPCCGRPFAPAQ